MGCLMKCVLSTIISLTAAMLAACSNSSTSSADETSAKQDSSSSEELSSSDEKYIVDERDGQKYRIVTIGSQTWMAENLNFMTEKSHCYNDVDSNCTKYGRLYTWGDAMDSAGVFSSTGKGCGFGAYCSKGHDLGRVRGICPEGWHLPDDEFTSLLDAAGGGFGEDTWRKLKSTSGWPCYFCDDSDEYDMRDDYNGTDDFGFSILPAGLSDRGTFASKGASACFWMSVEISFDEANHRGPRCDSGEHYWAMHDHFKDNGLSIRCVKDEPESSSSIAPSSSSKIVPIEGSWVDPRDHQTYKTVTIGTQTWLAQNMNYNDEKSSCYNNEDSNCVKYGRLYSWIRAMDACLGAGLDFPSDYDYEVLFANVGGQAIAGKMLKSGAGWESSEKGNGTDEYLFSVLPTGFGTDGSEMGQNAYFWIYAGGGINEGYVGVLGNTDEVFWSVDSKFLNEKLPVRCLL